MPFRDPRRSLDAGRSFSSAIQWVLRSVLTVFLNWPIVQILSVICNFYSRVDQRFNRHLSVGLVGMSTVG